jgi:predicted alpha/beta hydrolase family esterase
MALMRTSDCEILIVPGLTNSGPDHWQSRWQHKLSTARRVEQDDWERPRLDAWTAGLRNAVASASKPVVLVAHSLGVLAVAIRIAAMNARRTSPTPGGRRWRMPATPAISIRRAAMAPGPRG